MIEFRSTIERFREKGEKTGWSYIEISQDKAEELYPGNKKSFRVKGKLDAFQYEWMALIPMGDGSFILPLNAEVRKRIKKEEGDQLQVQMEPDKKEKPLSEEFIGCLKDAPAALNFFQTLHKGHQRYFSNWIDTAKTEGTKAKRITQALIALEMGLGFSEMVRMNKKATSK